MKKDDKQNGTVTEGRYFLVHITETLSKTVVAFAKNEDSARDVVADAYNNEQIILYPEDMQGGVDIQVCKPQNKEDIELSAVDEIYHEKGTEKDMCIGKDFDMYGRRFSPCSETVSDIKKKWRELGRRSYEDYAWLTGKLLCLRSDKELGATAYECEWRKYKYSYNAIMQKNPVGDFFYCLQNGKIYIPCNNELFVCDGLVMRFGNIEIADKAH